MAQLNTLKIIIADVLNIDTKCFCNSTQLLGSIPELDSMGVMMLLLALEDEFNMCINNLELTSDSFSTIASLQQFICENRVSSS
jgi:acyl carrier protein